VDTNDLRQCIQGFNGARGRLPRPDQGEWEAALIIARDLMARLTEEHSQTPVHVRVIDADVVRLQVMRPRAGALATQAAILWPAQIETLQALRI
jgi:hypothetical protein